MSRTKYSREEIHDAERAVLDAVSSKDRAYGIEDIIQLLEDANLPPEVVAIAIRYLADRYELAFTPDWKAFIVGKSTEE